MDTPGFDPASVTGLVAGGANVVCFTTGRGSCFGCKPTPSIKIATNTPMYERMIDDMDINAGAILDRHAGRRSRPARSSSSSWKSPAAARPRANSTASAKKSSPPGASGRRFRNDEMDAEGSRRSHWLRRSHRFRTKLSDCAAGSDCATSGASRSYCGICPTPPLADQGPSFRPRA